MKGESEQIIIKTPPKKDFLLVGIGASAGGIQALREFFVNLPDNTGMAYVIILHLSKDFESNLHHILQLVTSMPVAQVTETLIVEINHVYVIPPGKHLEVVDGVICLKELHKLNGRPVTIDHFFRSLAEAYGSRAICIVLSGSGTDGTLGMKHVKGKNGFAIAQLPEDAEFDSMPKSAIDTGLIDVILPVAEMGAKLVLIQRTTEQFHLLDEDSEKVAESIKSDDSLRELLTLLKVRTGNDFTNYKRPTLLRRITRHLQIHEVPDIPTYLPILRNRPEEAPFLVKNLLINVTNFFRDKVTFENLELEVVPRLFEGKTGEDVVRVWVAGCASGEEVYSMAILLSEHAAKLADPPKIQLFASDVDDEAMAETKEGHYLDAISEDVSPARLKQFFTKEKVGYQIKKSIREMVLCATHNLLSDPPFSRLDMVSCRNVLIYLNRETQEKLMRVFHFALKSEGVLFLGSSESADTLTNLFAPMDKKHRFYLRRGVVPSSATMPQIPIEGKWQVNKPDGTAATKLPTPTSFNLLHHRLLDPYLPPSVLINENYDILHLSENAGRYLRFVGGEVSSNLLKVVLPALRADLRATLFSVNKQQQKEESRPISLKIDTKKMNVTLVVTPVKEPETMKGAMMVLFKEEEDTTETVIISAIRTEDEGIELILSKLEEEIQRTKDQLQNTIEQYETSLEELKASNEEQQAINEELRSASEELETGKEEIQSVNEELTTVNLEMKEKVEDISRINSDLQNLMASTNIGTIFLDRQLQIKRYTPHLQASFNIISTDVGRPLYHLKHNFNYDNFKEDAEQVLRSLQSIEREIQDKDNRYYLLRYFPYRTKDDKIDGVVLTFVDITERREAEITGVWLSSVVDSTVDAIINFTSEGTILTWNKGAEHIFGYNREDAIGKNISMLTPPGQGEQEQFFDALQSGKLNEHKQFETTNVRKDGVLIITCLTALIIKKGTENELLSATVMVEDMTKRKRATEQTRASLEEMETLMEVTPMAIFVTHDAACTSITGNSAAHRLVGIPEDSQLNISKSAPKDVRPTYRVFRDGVELKPEENPMQVSAREGKVVREDSLELLFEDGSRKFIFAYVNPLFDEIGKPRGAVAAMMDITDRKLAEAALQEKNKELEQFAYVASHDLQEPLNTITSFIELLEEDGQSSETVKEYLHYMKSSAKRLTCLIVDMLNHSRIGKQGNMAEVDCAKLVKEVLSDMKSSIESKGAVVKVGKLPVLKLYLLDMRMLFQNLISNAIKFQREGVTPQVIISAKEDGRFWHFLVEDNGIGIEARFMEKIFVIFQRLHVEEEYQGTGIGLAHCKKIVELHKGRIWLESQLGKGTKFHFTIEKFT